MIMMRQEDIALKIPERILQADERRLPVIDDFQVDDDLVEVLIPLTILILPQGSFSVADLGGIVKDTRYQYDGHCVIRPCLSPSGEEFREKRVDNLLVITFSVARKLPQFTTDLDEYRDFGRK